jgi:hypothetical protein
MTDRHAPADFGPTMHPLAPVAGPPGIVATDLGERLEFAFRADDDRGPRVAKVGVLVVPATLWPMLPESRSSDWIGRPTLAGAYVVATRLIL